MSIAGSLDPEFVSDPAFRDEAIARKRLEGHRWPAGRICLRCKTIDCSTAIGLRGYQCNVPTCRKQFTVTVGTPFYRSHIPLSTWAYVAFLFNRQSSITPVALQKATKLPYKTAFSVHSRLSEMRPWLVSLLDSASKGSRFVRSSERRPLRSSSKRSDGTAQILSSSPLDLIQRDITYSPLRIFSDPPDAFQNHIADAFQNHIGRLEQAVRYMERQQAGSASENQTGGGNFCSEVK